MMLTVATHSSVPPYLAVTAGPASHSPPPMALAPMTKPGPSIARILRHVKIGALISSPVSQRGMALLPGCGASNLPDDGAGSAMAVMYGLAREGEDHRMGSAQRRTGKAAAIRGQPMIDARAGKINRLIRAKKYPDY